MPIPFDLENQIRHGKLRGKDLLLGTSHAPQHQGEGPGAAIFGDL